MAHRGYSEKFSRFLAEPGIRVPLTTTVDLWRECVQVGRRVIWLHTFGERFYDDAAGRPSGALALAESSGIRLHSRVISRPPGMPESILPQEIPGSDREINLLVGGGSVGPVKKEVWEYEVNGMRVIRHWFDSRSESSMHKRGNSGLAKVNYGDWTPSLTSELLAMLSVLNGCVELEPIQSRLLDQACMSEMITSDELLRMHVLPAPGYSTKGPSPRQLGIQTLPGI